MSELEVPVIAEDDVDIVQSAELGAIRATDRADAPVSEVTERFLRAITAKVPLARIEELHLFAPLKQGGTETGIAVIAARAPLPAAAMTEPLESMEPIESTAAIETDTIASANDTSEGEDAVNDAQPYLNDDEVADLSNATHVPVEMTEIVADTRRHTVYTARYRLVLKGPERGKWEADVVDEADAPLITVEMVVRGVQRRAGEDTEIVRYSDRQIARALRMEWPPQAE